MELRRRVRECCGVYIKRIILNKTGWTIIDTLISVLIFSIVIFAIFLTINHVSSTSIKSTHTLLSDTQITSAEITLKRLISSSGNGVPNILNSSVSEKIQPIEILGYNETPQSFKPTGKTVKFIDGNNDSKHGFGYVVVRSCSNILALDTPRWAVVESDGKKFYVSAVSESLPKPKDITTVINATDGSIVQICTLKKGIEPTDNALNFSTYGLPSLKVGKYIICSIKNGDVGSTTGITPYNRVDIVLTSLGNPSYCAKGSYSLSLVHYNPVDGSESVIPLINCVAGFKIKFLLNKNNSMTWVNDLSSVNPLQISKTVKAIALFLVVQTSKELATNQNKSCLIKPFVYNNSGSKISVNIDFSKYITNCKRYKWRGIAFVIPLYSS